MVEGWLANSSTVTLTTHLDPYTKSLAETTPAPPSVVTWTHSHSRGCSVQGAGLRVQGAGSRHKVSP